MVLFLDFDGVLHPESEHGELFCRTPYLWRILRTCSHVSVVFSTAWREMYPMKELVRLATEDGGEDLKRRFVGVTPQIDPDSIPDDAGCRETECLVWLSQNGQLETPWLALDDLDYLFSPSSPNLYLTDFNHGLTEADVRQVIKRLGLSAAKRNAADNQVRLPLHG
jgi:hypothetical protein